jgi:hypothetical protein
MLYSHGLRERERAIGYCLIVQKQENEKYIFLRITCLKSRVSRRSVKNRLLTKRFVYLIGKNFVLFLLWNNEYFWLYALVEFME